jgi:hypothetical protein
LPAEVVPTLRLAERLPEALGVKVTVIAQVPLTGTLPQALVSANDELPEPEIVTLLTDNGAEPVLIIATV